MFGKIKTSVGAILTWCLLLGFYLTPFLALIASILTTIKWYSLTSSVVHGVLGFIVGGLVSVLVLGAIFTVMGVIIYATFDKELKDYIKGG